MYLLQDKNGTTVRWAGIQGLAMIALKFYDNPAILRKCVLLLKCKVRGKSHVELDLLF